jgi:hypothetical protein
MYQELQKRLDTSFIYMQASSDSNSFKSLYMISLASGFTQQLLTGYIKN